MFTLKDPECQGLGVAILLVLLTVWFATKSRSKGDVVHVPGPVGGHWLWGHELQAFRQQATQAYSTWLRQYGPVIKIKGALFHHDILVITDNTAVQHIFQNCYLYVKSPAFRPPIVNLLGEGIVWAEDEMHKQHRQTLLPAFTAENVKKMAPAVIESAEIMKSKLTDHIQSTEESTINIMEWTSSTTLDIIGKVGFGHDFQFGASEEAKAISSTWHKHVNEGITSVGFIAPLLLRTIPWITNLPIKALKAQGEIKIIVGRLSRAIVYNEKAAGESIGRMGTDVLSMLLRANEQNARFLSEKHVIDNISTLVMVGHETTSSSLTATLLCLARAPDIQSRLREELHEAAKDPNYLSYDNIHKLAYLDAVMKESMRLYPASPQTERVVLKDSILPLRRPIRTRSGRSLTSLSLKAGQVIHIPFMSMQNMPAVWGDDADSFKPTRWIDEKGLPPVSERPHGWSSLNTFCDGPRSCLGYRLAIYEFKVILAHLIQYFYFHPTSAEVELRISPTLQPVVDGEGGKLPLKVSLV